MNSVPWHGCGQFDWLDSPGMLLICNLIPTNYELNTRVSWRQPLDCCKKKMPYRFATPFITLFGVSFYAVSVCNKRIFIPSANGTKDCTHTQHTVEKRSKKNKTWKQMAFCFIAHRKRNEKKISRTLNFKCCATLVTIGSVIEKKEKKRWATDDNKISICNSKLFE